MPIVFFNKVYNYPPMFSRKKNYEIIKFVSVIFFHIKLFKYDPIIGKYYIFFEHI